MAYSRHRGRFGAATARVAITAVFVTLACAPAAEGRGDLRTGFRDPGYQSQDPAVRELAFDRTEAANAGTVRLLANWRAIAASEPADPANPADPAYRDWARLDAAVREAAARGLRILITVNRAPAWAEGANRDSDAPPGSWKPSPEKLEQFAQAIARRYSGEFPDPLSDVTLPAVRFWQPWAEANLPSFLTPQYEGVEPVGAQHYRMMLNAFYRGVNSVAKANVVVTAGTAPHGDPPQEGLKRARPLEFWREVFCLDQGGDPQGECAAKAQFDVLAHHPINFFGDPRMIAENRDDLGTAVDMRRLVRLLRAAEDHRTISGGRHDLWVTEFWWLTDPPFDSDSVDRPALQARFLQETLYLLWKVGVSTALWGQIADTEGFAIGVYSEEGEPKPSATALRFPFVVESRRKGKLFAWGIAPRSGRLSIARGGGPIVRLAVRAGDVFHTRFESKRRGAFQARINGERSLVWRLEGSQ